jgi:hypothetical protein
MTEGARGLKKPEPCLEPRPSLGACTIRRGARATRRAARPDRPNGGPQAKTRASPGLLRFGCCCARQSSTAPCCHALPGCCGAFRTEEHGAVVLRPVLCDICLNQRSRLMGLSLGHEPVYSYRESRKSVWSRNYGWVGLVVFPQKFPRPSTKGFASICL